MRTQLFGLSLALAVAGCGGDGDGGKVMVMPDAKVFMDAPPVTTPPCEAPASIPGGMLGSDTMRQSANWIRKNMAGTITFFAVSIPIDQAMTDYLTILAIKQGSNWTINTPINFDPSPTSTMPAAAAFIDENLNLSAGTSQRTLYASSGSMTFTEIAQTAGAKITFSTTAANFREVDGMTGADIAGGCTSMTAPITVYLTQMTAVAFVPPDGSGPADWRKQALDLTLRAQQ